MSWTDEDEIFGNEVKVEPKITPISQAEASNPLRKIKILLSSFLLAEQNYVSAPHIAFRMRENGDYIRPQAYGCETLDELFQMLPDTLTWTKDTAGKYLYAVKQNECNSDIRRQVLNQMTEKDLQKKRERNKRVGIYLGKANPRSTYGAAFSTHILGLHHFFRIKNAFC